MQPAVAVGKWSQLERCFLLECVSQLMTQLQSPASSSLLAASLRHSNAWSHTPNKHKRLTNTGISSTETVGTQLPNFPGPGRVIEKITTRHGPAISDDRALPGGRQSNPGYNLGFCLSPSNGSRVVELCHGDWCAQMTWVYLGPANNKTEVHNKNSSFFFINKKRQTKRILTKNSLSHTTINLHYLTITNYFDLHIILLRAITTHEAPP